MERLARAKWQQAGSRKLFELEDLGWERPNRSEIFCFENKHGMKCRASPVQATSALAEGSMSRSAEPITRFLVLVLRVRFLHQFEHPPDLRSIDTQLRQQIT